MSEPLSRQSLIDSFRTIGIGTGTRLVVHSALRNLGPIDGGADTVLDALLTVIGPQGLLIMPTFTYANSVFDPATTRSATGSLTEVLRKRPGAVRSWHPTHSVAAIGSGAAEVCADHHLRPGLGIDSPLDRVAAMGGAVLFLGIGHASNSTVHVGEAHARVPYLSVPFNQNSPRVATVLTPDPVEVELIDPPGCSRAFGSVEFGLRKMDAIRDTRIAHGLVQYVLGKEIIRATVEMLASNPGALLCNDPACYRCTRSKEMIREAPDRPTH